MTDFSEQRSCIKLCYELGKSATETLGVLRSIYGNNALCRSKTFHWYSRFRDGQIPGGKPDVSQDFPPSSSSSTAKQSGKRGNKRRKTMENPQIPNNFDVTVIEAQLNYVKMLMKLGKTPSETYTCMQALFGPNAISRIDLLQLYFKLETDQNLSGNILPPIIKPPRKQRASFPAHTKGGTAVQPPVEAPAKRQTQSRVDLMTGGSFWHAPFNDEKENTSLTENQVCFMDHFMLSGDSNQSNSYKITLPKNGDRYQDSYNSGVSMPNLVDGNLPLPLPVETLNRMHVMDGDCSKADIVAEKAPELQLPSPAAEAAVAANGHDAADHEGDHQDQDVVKQGLKGVVMKEQPKEAEAAVKQDEKDAVKRNGDVSDVIDGENRPIVVNGSDALVTSDKDDSETKTNLVNGDSKVVDVEKIDENMVVDEAEDGPKAENGVEDVPMQDAKEDESEVKDESAVKEEEEEEEEEEVEKKNDNQEEEEEAPSVASSRKDETVKDEGVAVVSEDEERTSVTSSQNRKRRLPDTNGDAENCDNEAEGEGEMEGDAEVEGEGEGEGEGSSSDSESGTKRQRVEVEGEDERERLVREYVERCTQSVEEMSRNADKLQREIGALGELARAKELEWNSILRLRKLKEEMLERLLRRRRQTMMLADNGLSHDWANDFTKSKANKNNSNNHLMMVPIVSSSPGNMTSSLQTGAINRAILSPDTTRLARLQRPILPKPTAAANHSSLIDQQNTVIGEGRQGPILDVKSIIADYRSRHPADNVPRRGRRMKMAAAGAGAAAGLVSSTRITGSPALMSMANMALCSGAHIRNNSQDCNTGQENSRPSSTDSTRSMSMHSETTTTTTLPAPGLNFKDVLVQFAKMSQPPAAAVTSLVPSALKQPHPPPPPPYPEVTLHPVPAPTSHSSPSPPTSSHSSSLLHGILTKSSAASVSSGGASSTTTSHRPTTFSPTLARLLTAPERERTAPSVTATSVAASHFRPPVSRVSISDLLTTSKKTRNEITITPVSSHSSHPKSKDGVVLLEDDPEETDSTDRLVIDESGGVDQKDEQGGGGGDEAVPECQGCNQRAAQFVCAGCGNQWYCSRECQVTAWEEHSEMCSG